MKKTNKIMLALILSLLMAAALSLCALAEEYYSPGDTNMDGVVNSKDAVLIAQFLAEWDVNIGMQLIGGREYSIADTNHDGTVNSKDAVLAAQFLAGWDVEICGHWSVQNHPAKAASCSEQGNIAYWQCDYCKACASDNGLKNKLSEEDIIVTVTHTIDTSGIKCLVCGELLYYTEGLEYTLIEDGNAYAVSGIGTATDLDIVIPKKYNGKPVTKVENDTFYCNNLILSVVIPSSITKIGDYAFYSCGSLERVTMSEGVKYIGYCVFDGCSSLTTATIPDSVEYIGSGDFKDCPIIKKEDGIYYFDNWVVGCEKNAISLDVRDGTRGIATGALQGCFSALSVNIPDSVLYIGDFAISGDLIETVKIGSGVKKMGSVWAEAVISGSSLKSIEVDDDNLYFMDDDGVLYDKNQTELIRYPSGKTEKLFTIPNGVIEIRNGTFFDCVFLEEIIIPNGVEEIWVGFVGCTSLKYVQIPTSVTYIGPHIFRSINPIAEIRYSGTMEQWYSIEKDENWIAIWGEDLKFSIVCIDGTIPASEA